MTETECQKEIRRISSLLAASEGWRRVAEDNAARWERCARQWAAKAGVPEADIPSLPPGKVDRPPGVR